MTTKSSKYGVLLVILYFLWRSSFFKKHCRFLFNKIFNILPDSTHIDFDQIQVCLLTTEHLSDLGRVEKRTILTKRILDFFGHNSYVVSKVLDAARKAIDQTTEETNHTSNYSSVLTTHLSQQDKWLVLNACTNHISSVFAPYHIFFNEARRCNSCYRSAWYAFTVTCSRSSGGGRFFVTPHKPLAKDGFSDQGAIRIRVILVNESELRDIAAGDISAPDRGFFNERHRDRFKILTTFSELFTRQLLNVTGSSSAGWGPNLCGRLTRSNTHQYSDGSPQDEPTSTSKQPLAEWAPEDNCFLRLHTPYPVVPFMSEHHNKLDLYEQVLNSNNNQQDMKSRDVVIYE